jgi:hypothetical protein
LKEKEKNGRDEGRDVRREKKSVVPFSLCLGVAAVLAASVVFSPVL